MATGGLAENLLDGAPYVMVSSNIQQAGYLSASALKHWFRLGEDPHPAGDIGRDYAATPFGSHNVMDSADAGVGQGDVFGDAPGYVANSLDLDLGSSERLASNEATIGIADVFSISCWIKRTDADTSTAGYFFEIKADANSNNRILLDRASNNPDQLELNIADSAGSFFKVLLWDGVLPANTWVHVAMTYDGSEGGDPVRMYINGVLTSPTTSTSDGTGTLTDTARRIWIGGTVQFVGRVHSAAVWNTELTAVEIKAIYNRGVGSFNLNAPAFELTEQYVGDGSDEGNYHADIGAGTRTVVNPGFALPPKIGGLAQTFEENWYNRIHVLPSQVDLGNVIAAQARTFDVWNAYFVSRTLNSIGITGGQGITLTRPGGAPSEPATYDPLELLTYSLSISQDGPPSINAVYEFFFNSGDSPAINVIGSRLVFFPFSAQAPIEEMLEFSTTMLESYDGHEQRIQVRERPRQTFGMNYLLSNNQEISILKNTLIGNAGRLFGVAMWQESRPLLANVGIGATSVTVTTTDADFRPGLVVLWRSVIDFEVVEVGTVNAGSLDLALATTKAATAGITRVVPIRFCYLMDSNSSKVRVNNVTAFDAEWRSIDFTDLSSDAGFTTTYKSMPVLLDPNYTETELREAFRSKAFEQDPGTGLFAFTAHRDVPEYQSVKTWIFEDAAGSFALRRSLYALRGRQRSFWLPTFRPDFQLVQDVGSSDTQLVVSAVEFGRFVGLQAPFTDVIIQTASGVNYLREITNFGTSGDNETITIDSSLGAALAVADVLRISYLVRSRLGSDRIEIRHNRLGAVQVSVPVIGVLS